MRKRRKKPTTQQWLLHDVFGRFNTIAAYNGQTYGQKAYSKRGVQKVCRLIQLITRYVNHILSFLNTVCWNWNALGPAFLRSSDSITEELLILLFQRAICCTENVPPQNCPSHGGSGPNLRRCSLGPPRDQIQHGISIGSAVLHRKCGLIISRAVL